MNILKTTVLLPLATLVFNVSLAQEINLPDKPMSSVDIAALYIPGTIIKAAEQMPKENYSYRPTPDVRSFGELIAHIAESNFEMCAIAKGEDSPMNKVATTKAEALEALKKSFDYFARAKEGMTAEQKKNYRQIYGQSATGRKCSGFCSFSLLKPLWKYSCLYATKRTCTPIVTTWKPGKRTQR